MIAMATAASAAAIVMMKMVNVTPSSFPGKTYLLNATKLMFTLFNINSTAINIVIIFLLVNSPNMPIKNKAVLTKRMCVTVISFIIYQFNFFSSAVFIFIAITIAPIIAASNNMLTTSKGNIYPCSEVLNRFVPISETFTLNGSLVVLKPC
jgi:hypothetical protein